MKPIIIIGSGMAGISLAREYRKLNTIQPLMIITADDGGFYAKPMLSNAFAQNKTPQQLQTQTALQLSAQLNATILQQTVVKSIDAEHNRLETSMGIFDFDQLILAVGAQAIRLDIQGNAANKILSINNLTDYTNFRADIDQTAKLKDTVRITIIGAGLIGCEFADDLARAGFHVDLIDPNQRPLAALAPEPISQALQQALIEQGVHFHLETSTSRVDFIENAYLISLNNGEQFETDLVLSAVGLRPDLSLSKSSLPHAIASDRGILINQFGQTNFPQIYALGDCAQYTLAHGLSSTMPYIAPIMTAARSIAKSLTGELTKIEFKAMPVIVKTPSCPIALIAPSAQIQNQGSWQHQTLDNGTILSRFLNHANELKGFAMTPQDAKIRNQLTEALQA
jgi:rubredoxin-NAD+ reductase